MAYQLTHYRQYRTRASLFERWRTPALLAAAILGAAYWYVRNKTRAAARENPPGGKFVAVDGVRLHHVERDQAPPGACPSLPPGATA